MSKVLYKIKRDSLIKIADDLPANYPHYSIILEAISDCLEEMREEREDRDKDRQAVKIIVVFSLALFFYIGFSFGYNVAVKDLQDVKENVR